MLIYERESKGIHTYHAKAPSPSETNWLFYCDDHAYAYNPRVGHYRVEAAAPLKTKQLWKEPIRRRMLRKQSKDKVFQEEVIPLCCFCPST